MSGGKGRLLLFAGVCVLGGLLLNSGEYLQPSEHMVAGGDAESSLRTDWTGGSQKRIEVEKRAHSWGDAAIRFGGSFMVAMIIGSLLRVFVRTMVIALVVAGGLLWFLNDRGMVEPFWEDAFDSWGHAKDWIVAQTRTGTDFLRGYVPSMTAGLVGLGFGLRK
jgi:uncharacterized membrane protein (Fun14 family)